MSDAGQDVYQNVRLHADHSQIRLLQLEPSPNHPEAPVKCTLILATLDDVPKFEALSYAWGNQRDLKTIRLNGSDFQVTTNLESALRYLREKDSLRTLWVDAVCINQRDVAERSSQVAMMHDIYQSAQRTVSWLGEGGEDGELALKFLYWYAKRKVNMHPADVDGHFDEYEAQGWSAVTSLMRRAYWRRLWVMQEIAFSQVQPQIYCGTKDIQWGTLKVALGDSESAYYIRRLDRVRGATRELIRQGSKGRPSRNGRHIIFLLSHSSGFETSEPRDRIYALYGLIKVAGIVDFKPDYNKSVPEVYRQITEFVLRMKNSLNILELRSHLQTSDVPSWVIDFSKQPPKSFPHPKTIAWQRMDEQKQTAIPEMNIDSATSTLEVSGTIIDQIVSIHSVPSCVATVLRRAAEDPDAEQDGGDSLRSSNKAAFNYWDQLQDPKHDTAICQNATSYLRDFKEIAMLICRTANENLPEWYPRPWDREGVDCSNNDIEFDSNYSQSLQWVLSTLSLRLHGRTCFRTKQGFVGAALVGIEVGDKVVAFQSTKQMHVLKPRGGGSYQYAGAAVIAAPEGKEKILEDLLRQIRGAVAEDHKFRIV